MHFFFLLLKLKSFQDPNIVIIRRWKRLNNPSGFFCVEPVKQMRQGGFVSAASSKEVLCSLACRSTNYHDPPYSLIRGVQGPVRFVSSSLVSHEHLVVVCYYFWFSVVKLKCWQHFLTLQTAKVMVTSTPTVRNDQHVATSCQTLKHVSIFLLTGFLLLILKSFVRKPRRTFANSGERSGWKWCIFPPKGEEKNL